MLTIIQTNYNGIDALTTQQQPVPHLTENGVLIQMQCLPVVPSDWKREMHANATAEQLAKLPRIIGVGGVGRVIAVGAHRDATLLNQRVLVLQPTGTYCEILLSEHPDQLFPLPDSVDNASAASLIAGPGTAKVLLDVASNHPDATLIITGANSVIGLFLLQLLAERSAPVYPVVSPASHSYFNVQQTGYAPVTTTQLPTITDDCLILDIAGSMPLLQTLLDHTAKATITSIALTARTNSPVPFQFVHESFAPNTYRNFIAQLADNQLIAPIDRTFSITQIKQAQHYASESHSRGRVLVTLPN
jgi:NADPH:quinone reductase-like Zn-dependent oxidoreductase